MKNMREIVNNYAGYIIGGANFYGNADTLEIVYSLTLFLRNLNDDI